MAICVYCARSGWFLQVDGLGLCDKCQPEHFPGIVQNCRLYHASVSTAVKSKNPSVTLTRLIVAAQCCQELRIYEVKGIPTIGMPLDEAIKMLDASFDAAVQEATKQAVDFARNKAITAASDTSRLTGYSSAADRMLKLAAEFPGVEAFVDCARDLQMQQDALRVEIFLKKSAVAQAKGQKKKAIDLAIDAHMAIRHDATPDEHQTALKARVTAWIETLGGTVP